MSAPRRWLLGLLAVVVVLTLGAGLWWRADPGGDDGLTLYLPDLRGAEPAGTRNFEGAVRTQFEGLTDNEAGTFILDQRPAPGGSLCQALGLDDAPYPCREDDGALRFTFEESSTVAVVRDSTLLVASFLRTEDDDQLLEDAVRALQEAPETARDELAAP